MNNFFSKVRSFIVTHKITSIIIILVLVFGIYEVVKAVTTKAPVTTYTLGTVTRGTIVATVTGTGQVSANNQITVEAQSSGPIASLKVIPGDHVYAGQVIATIDNPSAKLSLIQAQNNLAAAELDYTNTDQSQKLALSNQNITLNSTVVALADPKNVDSVAPTLSGGYDSTEQGTYTLKTYTCQAISGMCINYSGIESGNFPITTNIPAQLGTRGLYITFATLPKLNDTWYINVPSPASNNYLANTQSLAEQQQSDNINLSNKQQAIATAKVNLASAQLAYDDTAVTSPIDGQVGQVSVIQGQQVGSGTTIATLVTNQLFADIPLNEVDVAKVKIGDRVTATFDALPDLTMTGKVVSIDLVGTVTQGVVNYNVKIAFDTQDDRVKSGMSISVIIATDVHQDVLTVPSSAVKTRNGNSYVLTAKSETDPAPVQVPVTTGISDDTNTEILSGLNEGDSIVVKSSGSTSSATATTTAPSILNSLGGNRGGGAGGGAARALGR